MSVREMWKCLSLAKEFAYAESHNISRDVLNKLCDEANPQVAEMVE